MSVPVDPRDVEDLAAQLEPAIGALEGPGSDELWADFLAWCCRPLDWLTAPLRYSEGRSLEARLALLQGPRGRDYNTGPDTIAGADAPPASTAHGLVTPSDVLAYRQLWDPFVTGTANACNAVGKAWDAAAAAAAASPPQAMPAGLNLAQFQFQGPPDPETLTLWAQTQRANADAIMALWNDHADEPDAQIVLGAGDILQDFQKTVLKVGQYYQAQIARDWPSYPLPMPPDDSLQTEVIARVEGLGILAHGTLQLIGLGVGGAIDTLGAIGAAAGHVAEAIASPMPWIAVSLVAGVVLLVGLRR